jgi:hypothetical protein
MLKYKVEFSECVFTEFNLKCLHWSSDPTFHEASTIDILHDVFPVGYEISRQSYNNKGTSCDRISWFYSHFTQKSLSLFFGKDFSQIQTLQMYPSRQ